MTHRGPFQTLPFCDSVIYLESKWRMDYIPGEQRRRFVESRRKTFLGSKEKINSENRKLIF